MDWDEKLGPDTLIQHLGEEDHLLGAIAPPIFQASNYAFESVDDFHAARRSVSGNPSHFYSRITNPTVDLTEKKIAALEGVERCRLCGAGMGAISLALLANLDQGAHVVAVDRCYTPVKTVLNDYLVKFGISVDYVDGACADDVIDAIKPETKVVYLESPSSYVFRLQDVRKIAAASREKGVATLLDNTYSTPLFQSPAALGVDIVLHSASKYLGGHSDLLAGAICSSEERMKPILQNEINLLGAAPAPIAAWLLLRGLRTLSLRMARHQETANILASWLEEQPEVERVHHVGLPSFPQRALFQSQMRGSGGLFSFEPKAQDYEKIREFVQSLKLFALGVSWGGYESLALPIRIQPKGAESRFIVRLFAGLEDAKDLVADLRQAMDSAEL